ncbi:MAG: ABC transporter permease [Flavobacteriaceae bacterium]|nr:ABC transporter permease [Flavobacteriaceae bacterium]
MGNSNTQQLKKSTLLKLLKDFRGVFSFSLIVCYLLLAVFAYFLAPDSSSNANSMHLNIARQSPGFKCYLIQLPSAENQQESVGFMKRLLYGTGNASPAIAVSHYRLVNDSLFYRLWESESSAAPEQVISKAFTEDEVAFEKNYITSKTFHLGTDKYGRDMLSRMIIGTRISLSIGAVSVLISLVLGISLGAIGGYFTGWIDQVIVWLINVTWSIPSLLMVIAISVAFGGKGFWQIFIAVGLTMWVEVARIVRGQVKSVKEEQYITAAKVLGFSHFRILFKHIIPQVLSPVIVISAANFAAAILIESGLSFLGIGVQPPTPTWGGMIKDHYPYIILGKAWLALIPGIAIMSMVMAFMLLGNALRDALDVKN